MGSDDTPRAGLPGTLKLIATLMVLALAALASLLVLDVIPRETFRDMAGKLLALAGIAVVAALAIWAMTGRADKG